MHVQNPAQNYPSRSKTCFPLMLAGAVLFSFQLYLVAKIYEKPIRDTSSRDTPSVAFSEKDMNEGLAKTTSKRNSFEIRRALLEENKTLVDRLEGLSNHLETRCSKIPRPTKMDLYKDPEINKIKKEIQEIASIPENASLLVELEKLVDKKYIELEKQESLNLHCYNRLTGEMTSISELLEANPDFNCSAKMGEDRIRVVGCIVGSDSIFSMQVGELKSAIYDRLTDLIIANPEKVQYILTQAGSLSERVLWPYIRMCFDSDKPYQIDQLMQTLDSNNQKIIVDVVVSIVETTVNDQNPKPIPKFQNPLIVDAIKKLNPDY
ncbi:MAG: hypothetical protein AABX38_03865 [Candidatus Micrarchaeota archaeon]